MAVDTKHESTLPPGYLVPDGVRARLQALQTEANAASRNATWEQQVRETRVGLRRRRDEIYLPFELRDQSVASRPKRLVITGMTDDGRPVRVTIETLEEPTDGTAE